MPDDDTATAYSKDTHTRPTDLVLHTKLSLDAGSVSYVDPDVHIDHDCKMEVLQGTDDRADMLTFRCQHGSFTFPFGELNFKERG